jgi:DNA repair protein RecO (recombination protein O)
MKHQNLNRDEYSADVSFESRLGVGVYKTEGIILKKAELSDTDRLLTVYTEKFGKILVRAKGVGKKESKLKSLIEPFNIYEFLLARSKNIDVLANSYPIKEFLYLRQNLESLALAIYFAELVDKLVVAPEQDENIWLLLVRAFEVLDQKREDLPKLKEAFEKKLLVYLGHPSFAIRGKATEREKQNYLQSLAGDEIKSERFLRSLSLTS